MEVFAIEAFEKIVGKPNVITAEAQRLDYGHHKTEDYSFLPDAVLNPSTAEQVSAILKISNENKIPVTPRGAGMGLSGGALPVNKVVVVSMERFNKILNI